MSDEIFFLFNTFPYTVEGLLSYDYAQQLSGKVLNVYPNFFFIFSDMLGRHSPPHPRVFKRLTEEKFIIEHHYKQKLL